MTNAKPNLEKRKSRPQSFAAVLSGMLRAVGGRASDADIADKWSEIVGTELAVQAKIVSLSKSGRGVPRTPDPTQGLLIRSAHKQPYPAPQAGQETGVRGTPLQNRVSGRTLTIRAAVPAMATTLAYRTEEIRAAVNRYFGYDAVGSVKVKK